MLRLTLFFRLRVQLRERAKLVLVVVLVVAAKTLYSFIVTRAMPQVQ